jgi:hypothetical protein
MKKAGKRKEGRGAVRISKRGKQQGKSEGNRWGERNWGNGAEGGRWNREGNGRREALRKEGRGIVGKWEGGKRKDYKTSKKVRRWKSEENGTEQGGKTERKIGGWKRKMKGRRIS